ncbi:Transcriptional repressor SdpR [Mycobacteroides salmoniphilum]|uniref:Transcriptional repressor SdpR n=2 Tax=Mycobacteroides salmoniphilum TaxID=404941 RepID=A0A4R8S576_9MYCO|nr:Transcriptional repressor SdpR [Mycobacteroides salmoniphilum]TDZ83660.1 Transcriptional repressor SdpR [Mycobacteroides salmoniphilum]TDZ84594.1 Transcriptional repressor SdpR [Mycobacteroides salmoniphilum]
MVIADPTRRRIIDTLREGAADVTTLIERLDLSQSLMSKHLGVLRDAGTVRVEVAGKRRVYHLADDPLPAVLAWVTPYHRKWANAFDRLTFLIDNDPGTHDDKEEDNRD